MNKQQCLDHLDLVEKTINDHVWEGLCETDNLLTHSEMKDYLPSFNLPEPEGMFDTTVYLPVGWMEDQPSDSLDYQEVANRYEEVYELLRDMASQEMEALSREEAEEEIQRNRDYYRSVL
jgi:hypothetical protein